MADEQATPEHRGGVGADEAPAVNWGNDASVGRRKPSSGRSAGWWAIRFVLVILAVIIGGVIYLIDITVHPGQRPGWLPSPARCQHSLQAPLQQPRRHLHQDH